MSHCCHFPTQDADQFTGMTHTLDSKCPHPCPHTALAGSIEHLHKPKLFSHLPKENMRIMCLNTDMPASQKMQTKKLLITCPFYSHLECFPQKK